jgi:hypothetical protein
MKFITTNRFTDYFLLVFEMNSKNEILNSLQITLKELKNLETQERLEILQKLLKKFNFELELKNEESTEECKKKSTHQKTF